MPDFQRYPYDQLEEPVLNGGNDYYTTTTGDKRSVSVLAKNNIFPKSYNAAPKRSIPPILSAYKGVVTQAKRYLGALAKNGDLKYGRPQQKKYAAGYPTMMMVEELEPKRGEQAISPAIMKLELINSLKPVLLEYINEMGVGYAYDPRKVDLFLENLANAMYDRNEEYTLDHIKSLAQTGYFGKETGGTNDDNDNDDDLSASDGRKRNIQSLAREFNVSFAGLQPTTNQYEPKRNLESVVRNRGIGAAAPVFYNRYVKSCDYSDDCKENSADERDTGYWGNAYRYFSGMPGTQEKRHTMFDIDEPAVNVEYSTPLVQSAIEPADYNDYPEQDGAIPVGKRYLGKNEYIRSLSIYPKYLLGY